MLVSNPHKTREKQRVNIKYSPIIEIASSLRCLRHPESCPQHAERCAQILDSMDEATKAEFEYLSDVSGHWTLAIDLFCHLEQHNIESAKSLLTTFPDINDVEFAYGMLSGLVPKRTISKLMKQPRLLEEWQDDRLALFLRMDCARKIVADAPQLHKRMASFLKWYWETHFEDIWREIGATEIGCVSIEKNILAALGEDKYIQTCHPGLKIVNGAIAVADAPQCSWDLDGISEIDVFVTAYSGPHLMINQFEDTFTIFKEIAIEGTVSKDIGLEELAEFLKAIGSPTKFQILNELYKSPKTTKELAEALDMAPSSISEHLKTLRAAELLYPQRVKNSVYNRFLYENYQAFASRLLTYFDE